MIFDVSLKQKAVHLCKWSQLHVTFLDTLQQRKTFISTSQVTGKLDIHPHGDAVVVKPVTSLEQKNGLAEKYFSPTYQSECFQWQSEIHKRHGPTRIHRKVLG